MADRAEQQRAAFGDDEDTSPVQRGVPTGGDDSTPDIAPASLDSYASFESLPSLNTDQLVYLLLLLQTHGDSAMAHTPLNLCLVLDQSSSMRGDKLFQIKMAARQVVDQLTIADYFSLITFNDKANVVVPLQKVSSREGIKALIDSIEAKGGTEIATGLQAGIREMGNATPFTSLNYVLLLTDGQTYGDADRCVQLGIEAAKRRIVVHPMGVGHDWNEDLLESVAAKTGGTSEYIESPDDIVRIFIQKINHLRATLTHTASLHVAPMQGVRIQSIYRMQPTISRLEVDEIHGTQVAQVGPLGNGTEYPFLIEAILPPCPAGTYRVADTRLTFAAPTAISATNVAEHAVSLLFNGTTQAQGVQPEVKSLVERVTAFKLQARAWQDINAGNIGEGTKRLTNVFTKLLNMGEVDLARSVQAEIVNLEQRGSASAQGQKRIKFGTRGIGKPMTGTIRDDEKLSHVLKERQDVAEPAKPLAARLQRNPKTTNG